MARSEMDRPLRELPSEFFIGSAISAYQAENPWNLLGRQTDWDFFQQRLLTLGRSKLLQGQIGPDWFTPGKAEADIQTAKDLGMEAQRLGVEWGRVMSQERRIDQVALNRYRQQVDFIKSLGMIPLLTLNHFSLPLWVAQQGGWESSKTIKSFGYWSELVADNFGDVPYFVTINELNTLEIQSYLRGQWPPEKSSIFAFLQANSNLIQANAISYETIKYHCPEAQLGISNSVTWFKPNNPQSRADKFITTIYNRILNDQVFMQTEKHCDFLGMSFYTGLYLQSYPIVRFSSSDTSDNYALPKSVPGARIVVPERYKNDMGWPAVADFFLDALQHLGNKFKKPIIITENGMTYEQDPLASFYSLTHLTAIHEAIQRGVNILGYFHWATIDNLEWGEGYRLSGLIKLNPITGERTIRESARLLGEIAATNQIDIRYLANKYLSADQRAEAQRVIASFS